MSWSVRSTPITGVESSEFVHDILKLRREEKMKQEIYQRVINEPEYKDKRVELEEGMERLRRKIKHIQEMNLKTPSKHWDDVFAFLENTTILLFLLLLLLHVCRIIVVMLLPELFLECVLEKGVFEPSKFGTNFNLSWTMLFGGYPCVPVYLNCADDDQT
ncbi:uncharacterized protein LOC117116349 [Anneissia japonica]|uniref:uncharacterized protein LOC117116349 n=1 Tax=Anneissia japonica TaxID=1529436 RepID=UPI0014259874|nr:uncharacterized protein LOC117116349 [Anneissia japonica]